MPSWNFTQSRSFRRCADLINYRSCNFGKRISIFNILEATGFLGMKNTLCLFLHHWLRHAKRDEREKTTKIIFIIYNMISYFWGRFYLEELHLVDRYTFDKLQEKKALQRYLKNRADSGLADGTVWRNNATQATLRIWNLLALTSCAIFDINYSIATETNT